MHRTLIPLLAVVLILVTGAAAVPLVESSSPPEIGTAQDHDPAVQNGSIEASIDSSGASNDESFIDPFGSSDTNSASADVTSQSASAVSTQVELEAAIDDSEELSFTVSPESNETQSFSATAGDESIDVELEFARWENLDTGESGTSPNWEGPGDSTYEVTYEATAPPQTPTGSRSFDVSVSYDSGSASQTFDIDVIGPEFGTTETQSEDVILRGDQGVETTDSFVLNVPNQGAGIMSMTDIEFDGVPEHVQLDAALPDRIESEETAAVSVDATVEHAIDKGTYEIDATVEDNLGNEATYTVQLSVEKPPVVQLRSSPNRIENATAGETTTKEIVIDERSYFESVEGITVSLETTDDDIASLEFDDLSELTIDAGGSERTNVSVTIDEEAERNRELEWTLTLAPDDGVGVETENTIRTEVLHQARFADARLTNRTIVYDEPKDEIDVIEDTLTVDLENDGDFPLNVTGENVRIDGPELSVANVDVNDTIDERSSATAIINVEGDPEAFEQLLTLQFELFGQTVRNESVEPARFNESVEIQHERELVVETETIDFGRQQVTGSTIQEIRISERLGYQDIESFRLERLDGPENDWLLFVSEPPDTIPAGETVVIPIELAFTVDAELLTNYEWAFLASGDEVESREVVVSGEAEPVNLDPVRTDLVEFQNAGGDSGEIATEMLGIVDTVEEGVEDGSVPPSDIATSLSAGRSIVLLLSELDNAETTAEQEGAARAQESVVRAATAYNTFILFSQQFEDDRLVERAERIDGLARTRVDTLVDQQEDRFQRQLDEDPPLLEQAELNRQLSQLAVLRGDTERAQQLEADADRALGSYADRIEAGEQSFQDARDARERIANDHAIDAFGQPILVNPLRYDDFRADHRASLSAYEDSESSFREAGAGGRADTVAAERERVETELAVTRLSMFVSIGVYAVLIVLLALHISAGAHAHRRDRRAVAPDDFFE